MSLLIDPIYIISMYIQRSAEVSTLTQRHKAHETFGTKKQKTKEETTDCFHDTISADFFSFHRGYGNIC